MIASIYFALIACILPLNVIGLSIKKDVNYFRRAGGDMGNILAGAPSRSKHSSQGKLCNIPDSTFMQSIISQLPLITLINVLLPLFPGQEQLYVFSLLWNAITTSS